MIIIIIMIIIMMMIIIVIIVIMILMIPNTGLSPSRFSGGEPCDGAPGKSPNTYTCVVCIY